MALTDQAVADAEQDLETLAAVANSAAATVETRTGGAVKTLRTIIADLEAATDATPGIVAYRDTRAAGVADFAVGEYFTSAETGDLRLYKRTNVAPFYVDQGDGAAPLTIKRSPFRGNAGRTYGAIACVLRAATAGAWAPIDDGNHTPTPADITTTVNANGTLTVNYANAGGQVVGAITASPDEVMAGVPLTLGGSVGNNEAAFSFYCSMEIYVNGTALAAGYSYLGAGEALANAAAAPSAGFTWGSFLDVPNGVLTINHLSSTYTTSTTAAGFVDMTPQNISTTVDAIRLVTSGKTSKVFQSFNYLSGTISAAANPAVTHGAVVGSITAAWNAATGQLTLTTPYRKQKDAIVVSSRDPLYRAHVVSTTNTTVVVEFYDKTDTKFVGAASKACAFSSPTLVPCPWTSGCRLTVKGAPVFCYAQNINTTASGNFWLHGVMLREADPA